MERKYVVINSSDVSFIDFSQVEETSIDTLRWNKNNTKTFIKFNGDTPSFLSSVLYNGSFTYKEMLSVLNDVNGEWYIEDTTLF